ncbi:MSC_0622 family F1-like ATPase gamma subunit [Mesomycoplasma lagogenitalium]|uniref:ATP synthase gamma chain n=1 Tax=Mesomycoplasma lagogenitalium TaxID=171286 RepID=A0ABY8LWR1_9BACT|nr:hypothetical protein [Mesomycoplasma lagogenitalium]WGI37003.1 hypothetical protein QEG99_01815 [Mesomycoplasma lagogenitalium]
MHLKKIIQKKNNLQKIHLKVNSEKNILLISIMKLNQQLNFFVNNALSVKEIIKQLDEKYHIQNEFIEQNFSKLNINLLQKLHKLIKINSNKELWIYLKEEQKYATDSYSRYEKLMLENSKKNKIDFIALGEKANDFFTSNNLNIVKKLNLNDVNLVKTLSAIIKFLYKEERYSKIKFVINSNKSFNEPFTILPMNNFDSQKFSLKNLDVNKYYNFNIYPNISQYLETSTNIYIENIVQSLIIESGFYNAKNSLVKTNKILKDLDEQILSVSKKITRIKREKEIEEIVMLTRNNKSFSLTNEAKK